MNIVSCCHQVLLLLAVVIALGGGVVDGSTWIGRDQTDCHPTYTDICVGSSGGSGPIPAEICPDDFDPDVDSYELCNNTYIGGYHDTWNFYEVGSLPEEMKTADRTNLTEEENLQFTQDLQQYMSNFSISFYRNDDDSECNVTINAVDYCSTCTPCGDGLYSADCTNVQTERGAGRLVECEGIDPFFYPLVVEDTGATDEAIDSDSPEEPGASEDQGQDGEDDSGATSSSVSGFLFNLVLLVAVGFAGFL